MVGEWTTLKTPAGRYIVNKTEIKRICKTFYVANELAGVKPTEVRHGFFMPTTYEMRVDWDALGERCRARGDVLAKILLDMLAAGNGRQAQFSLEQFQKTTSDLMSTFRTRLNGAAARSQASTDAVEGRWETATSSAKGVAALSAEGLLVGVVVLSDGLLSGFALSAHSGLAASSFLVAGAALKARATYVETPDDKALAAAGFEFATTIALTLVALPGAGPAGPSYLRTGLPRIPGIAKAVAEAVKEDAKEVVIVMAKVATKASSEVMFRGKTISEATFTAASGELIDGSIGKLLKFPTVVSEMKTWSIPGFMRMRGSGIHYTGAKALTARLSEAVAGKVGDVAAEMSEQGERGQTPNAKQKASLVTAHPSVGIIFIGP